jgi:hypothetical protein
LLQPCEGQIESSTGYKAKCPAAGPRRQSGAVHAGSNIFAGVIKLAVTKEYRVTKKEIRRKVCEILLTNSETRQAQHG